MTTVPLARPICRAASMGLLMLAAACATAPLPQSRVVEPAAVDRTLKGFIEDGRAVGVSALVFEDGEEVFFGAYGLAEREEERAMARDTLVQIYSMTKPITGVALMTLYEEGLFSLDDPIATYIPELADLKIVTGVSDDGSPILSAPARQPTVRDIMRHTDGFADPAEAGPAAQQWSDLDPEALTLTLTEGAERMGQVPLVREPGSAWHYGPSVELQALMIERLSGMRLEDFLQQKIFAPLGMTETGYFVPEPDRDRYAGVYVLTETGEFARGDDAMQGQTNFRRWARNPGSWGLASTIDDYARFARMLLGEGTLGDTRILRADTVRLMATDHLGPSVTERQWLPSKGQQGFGLDFAVRTDPPQGEQENAGAVGEFFWDGYLSTLFWVDPENDLVAVFFTQTLPFDGTLHHDIRDAVYRPDLIAED